MKKLLSVLYIVGIFVKLHMAEPTWVYTWVLYSILFIYVSCFVRSTYYFVTLTLQYNMKLGVVISPEYFSQNWFEYLKSFVLLMMVEIIFPISVKNDIRILMRIVLSLYIKF